LDAIESYAKYRQEVEVTKQLEVEGEMLRVQLTEIRKQTLGLQALAEHEQRHRTDSIQRTLAMQQEELRIQRAHYDACKEQLRQVGAELVRLRLESSPSCQRLATLEKAFYRMTHQQIQAAIVLIDS
jgi:predicted secreted Zn-dependent protease